MRRRDSGGDRVCPSRSGRARSRRTHTATSHTATLDTAAMNARPPYLLRPAPLRLPLDINLPHILTTYNHRLMKPAQAVCRLLVAVLLLHVAVAQQENAGDDRALRVAFSLCFGLLGGCSSSHNQVSGTQARGNKSMKVTPKDQPSSRTLRTSLLHHQRSRRKPPPPPRHRPRPPPPPPPPNHSRCLSPRPPPSSRHPRGWSLA
jgi:hypothetical protein